MATRFFYDGFENGLGNWSYSSTNEIATDYVHSGTYSKRAWKGHDAQGSTTEPAFYNFQHPATNKLFLRFYFLLHKRGDENTCPAGKLGRLRTADTSLGIELWHGIQSAESWATGVNWGDGAGYVPPGNVRYPGNVVSQFDVWHKYELFIEYNVPASSSNGRFRQWINRPKGLAFESANAYRVINLENCPFRSTANPQFYTVLSLPTNFEGKPDCCPFNSYCYYDDVELWDDLPDTLDEPGDEDAGPKVRIFLPSVELQAAVIKTSSETPTAKKLIDYKFDGYSPPWPTDHTVTTSIPSLSRGPGAFPFRTTSDYTGSFNWKDFLASNQICVGNAARPAHGPTDYYLHHQLCAPVSSVGFSGIPDPYLTETPDDPPGGGRISASISSNAQIGVSISAGFPNPTNVVPVEFLDVLQTDYLFCRFWFRLTDNWATNYPHRDYDYMPHPWLKFVRLGRGYIGDNHGPNIHLSAGNRAWEQYSPALGWEMCVFDYPTHWRGFRVQSQLDDGEWHSICFLWQTTVHGNQNPNGELSVWVDDWNCERTPQANKFACYFPNTNTGSWRMNQIFICNNWNALYPMELMGLDIGAPIQVWDGAPTSAELLADELGASYVNIILPSVEFQSTVTKTSSETKPELGLGRYYWRVRAANDTITTGWSSTARFNTTEGLPAPHQLYCAETMMEAQAGSTNPSGLSVTRPWFSAKVRASDAPIEAVQIQVSQHKDAAFSQPAAYDSGWVELETPLEDGERCPSIQYGE